MKPIRIFTVLAMLAAMLGLAAAPASAAEGDEINLIGQRYSVQNNFNFAGDLTPFDTERTGVIRGRKTEVSGSSYFYNINFKSNRIVMNWSDSADYDIYEPYVGKAGGMTQEEAAASPSADEYWITLEEPITDYVITANSNKDIVPEIRVIDDNTFVVAFPGGTTIGDGLEAVINFRTSPAPERNVNLNGQSFTLQNNFNAGGELTPFDTEKSGVIRGRKTEVSGSSYFYNINFKANRIVMDWSTSEDYDIYEPYVGKAGDLTQEQAAGAPIADEYWITMSEPITGYDITANPDKDIVPDIRIIDDNTFVVSIPGGTTIGDGLRAVINFRPTAG